MRKRAPSLRRPLIIQPLALQLFILLVSFTVMVALLIRIDAGGRYTAETFAQVAADAVFRRADGGLEVRVTPALAEARVATPTTWFVAQDDAGRLVAFGNVPPEYASVAGGLGRIAFGDIRGRVPPYQLSVVVRRVQGPAGDLTILAHGELTALTVMIGLAANLAVIPIFVLLVVGSLILTPWIVRRSLAGVTQIATDAEKIDVDRRGIRLEEKHIPEEIAPLVKAMNAALARLDEGFERQERFIAAAAHELRTPIAILRLKVDAAGDAATRNLSGDVARLSNLAEQLLDLQRVDDTPWKSFDLPKLLRQVVGDLAPLLLDEGKDIDVVVDSAAQAFGNAGAVERVAINLIQNAIQHGGSYVTVRVFRTGFEVADDGPGIPADERERVFEAFHRVHPQAHGSGLGLSLVRQIVDRHGGSVAILAAPLGGTIVRVEFPDA